MTANLLTVNSSKTEFIFIGDWQDTQLHTYYYPLCSQPWLQVSAISNACYYHIRQRRCIRSYLDPTTTDTVSTYIVFSKLDYCNSLYYNLHKSPPSWMTANLLTSVPPRLNSYSLEIGKIHNTTLTTTHSARNLGFKFLPSPTLVTTILDSVVVSVLTLIPSQLLLLPSTSPNSITVILFTTTYISLRLPASNS